MKTAMQEIIDTLRQNPNEYISKEDTLRLLEMVGLEKERIPRRVRIDLNTPAEKSIYDAIQEVEKVGADVRLTEVVILLGKAKNLLADYIDEQIANNNKSDSDKFSEEELACLKARFQDLSLMDNMKMLFCSTNGGFGQTTITKENNKIIYYSHAPSDWDMDTGKVHGYSTNKIEYNTVEDCVSFKNGNVLIKE